MPCAVLSFSFFFFLILSQNPVTSSIDIITRTCETCAEKSQSFDKNFCFKSFKSVPAGPTTNLRGLGIISLVKALNHTTNTISSIKSLISTKSFDTYGFQCLEDCSELYSDGFDNLVAALREFLKGGYGMANFRVSAAMESASTCEGGFEEKEGEVSPLSKENYGMFQLCGVSLCIVNLLSSARAS